MKSTLLLSILAAATTSTAASIGLADELAHEFRLGLLPRQGPPLANNLQTFTGAVGGVQAPPITQSNDPKRQFEVDGETFVR